MQIKSVADMVPLVSAMQEYTGINKPSMTIPLCLKGVFRMEKKKKPTQKENRVSVEKEWLGHKACGYKNAEFNNIIKGL